MARSVEKTAVTDRLARVYLAALSKARPETPPPWEPPENGSAVKLIAINPRPRADVAAAAVLLARAVERAPVLQDELCAGHPVMTIETHGPDIVSAVRNVVMACLFKGCVHWDQRKNADGPRVFMLARDSSQSERLKNAENSIVADALHASAPIVGIAPDPTRQLPDHIVRAADHHHCEPANGHGDRDSAGAIQTSRSGRHPEPARDPSDQAVRRNAFVQEGPAIFQRRRLDLLLITVELLPGGSKAFRRTIAAMTIANVSGLAERSDYHVELVEGANPLSMSAGRSTFATVLDHDRRQSVWTLVSKAIARSLESLSP